MNANPLVCVVVLSWNRCEAVLRCLDQVAELRYDNVMAVVVDNGSTDESPRRIRSRFPGIELLELQRNLGYAGGANRGIERALELHADYVWLLNDDTAFAPDVLTTLVEHAERDERIGALSPLVYYEDVPDRVQFCGTFLDTRAGRIKPAEAVGQAAGGEHEVEVLVGAALLVRASALEAVGLFYEGYFAYWEDFDLTIRLTRAGYRLAVVAGARIHHSATAKPGSGFVRPPHYFYLITRNELLFWRRYLQGRFRRAAYVGPFLAGAIAEAASCRARGAPDSAQACLDAAWNALIGHEGDFESRKRAPRLFSRLLSWRPYFWSALFRGDYRNLYRRILRGPA
jgi:GT2 family glycosyltransferase